MGSRYLDDFCWSYSKCKILSKNRCQDKWPWISNLKASWTVSVRNKNFPHSDSLFLPTLPFPMCLMNTEVRLKRFPSGMGSHQKKKKKKPFRVQKAYEAKFSFETWGRFNIKTQNWFTRAHLDGDWEMKEAMRMSTLVRNSVGISICTTAETDT